MSRVDYYDDPEAPPSNSLVPAASAIVTDDQGRILLHRRRDNEMWALPGGVMELGESLGGCAVREVREETGLTVEPVAIVGVYSDPKHVFAYDDGEVRQEFSICFECRLDDRSRELLTVGDRSQRCWPGRPVVDAGAVGAGITDTAASSVAALPLLWCRRIRVVVTAVVSSTMVTMVTTATTGRHTAEGGPSHLGPPWRLLHDGRRLNRRIRLLRLRPEAHQGEGGRGRSWRDLRPVGASKVRLSLATATPDLRAGAERLVEAVSAWSS